MALGRPLTEPNRRAGVLDALVGVLWGAFPFRSAVLADGDFASEALAREAAVPCINLEAEAESVERVAGDLVLDGLGLGLAVPRRLRTLG